ncbi:S41 family peptidase [Ferruginibacter sp. HRS2-29]|uniref:S41 family peptidase n=1 Tax=Ferruginibacter sp. HRS2-29 TaxID=2487334 RepID=UPI0020CDF3EE|nr:S41 family peptidase [Ferruginibacter sp. HRS2-29]
MKPLLSFLAVLCMHMAAAQTTSSTSRLAGYIKVWGFAKYYHPAMGSGKVDADSVFLANIDKVLKAPDTKTFQAVLSGMWQQLGAVPAGKAKYSTAGLFTRNLHTGWIDTDKLLPTDVRLQLRQLRLQGYADTVHRYLPENFHEGDIPAEAAYKNISYPSVPYQLLALARYWNAIEYLYPYAYMLKKPWDKVLAEQLPAFTQPMAPTVFEKHLLQLNAAITDSHGGIVSVKKSSLLYGSYFPPFAFRFAGDTMVVTDYIDTASCMRQDIHIGDRILTVRNKPVAKALQDYDALVSASNNHKKRALFSSMRLLLPFRGFDSLVQTGILRYGKLVQQPLLMQQASPAYLATLTQLYQRETGNGTTTKNDFVLKSISNDIAWLDAANLSILYNSSNDDRPVDSVLQLMLQHKKAIVLDLRCYATQAVFYNKFLPALGRKLQPFVRLLAHAPHYPGAYYEYDIFSGVNQPPLLPAYTGKLILLVNENTHSQSELISMILQASGPTITVGTQTSGADGDIINMPIPGGYTLTFSGRHVSYRDGTPSQQMGVKRDVKVVETTQGIAEGKDEVLEAAMGLLKR